MTNTDLTDRIQSKIQSRSLLQHPFYQAWSRGTLPVESLKQYAGEYYHFELAYGTFLSGLHHRCTDRRVRQLLLENLWDEEHGAENHVELWLRFCAALGLEREEIQRNQPLASTKMLVNTYKELATMAPVAAGIAALYAFESQVPEVAKAKLEGLQHHYNIQEDRSVSFFTTHQTLDLKHAAAEQEMVLGLATTEDEQKAVLQAVDTATEALWQFLDGVYTD